MIYFLTRRPSEQYVWDYVKRIRDDGGPSAEVLCYEDVLEREEAPSGVYVFTGLNRFGPAVTRALEDLHSCLGAGLGFEPLNHPSHSLGRYELLKALHQEGLNDFRVIGAWEDLSDLRFPVFVRDRSQDGGIPKLLGSIKEVEVEVGWALVRGADLSELIVVEFLDTSDEDGLFRKYSAYIVGETIIPVSMERGRHWVLRVPAAEFTLDALKEEERFVVEGPHAGQLEKVRRIARIGFGRVDFSVYRGRVQTWEINTLPTMRLPPGVSPLPEELRPHRQAKRDFFKARFKEAWRELDSAFRPGPPVRLHLSDHIVRPALAEFSREVPSTFPQEERYAPLKTLLRPIKLLVMPLATRTVIPVLARSTMRKAVRGAASQP